MMKFGLIGFGNQAKRIIEIINSEFSRVQYKLFNHRKGLDNKNFENIYDLKDFNDCDAVFITTPNDFHFKYLEYLINNFNGYIFCEKPPVTNKNDLDKLAQINNKKKKKIYFNFNYRFSPFFESLKNDSEKYSLGRLVNSTVIQGHGLGFKEEYKNNWRSNKETHKNGVFETFSIHYFDMYFYMFGTPQKWVNFNSNLSPYGNSFDNSNFSCQFENNTTLNLTVSYTSPFVSKIINTYENGIIEIDTEKRIYAPRDCFSKDGRFTTPNLIYKEQFNYEIQKETTKKSVLYFCNTVLKKTDFNVKLFDTSVQTNKFLFD